MAQKLRAILVLWVAFSLYVQIDVSDLLGEKPASVAISRIEPPEFSNGKQAIPLPEVVDDIDVGGGGRYLALHFKFLHKIGILDVNQLKIVGYVPAHDDDTKYAAGATKLIVVSGDSGVVARWDLATQKRELAQSIDLGGAAGHVVLGSASAGPALVSGVGRGYDGAALLLDLETLRTTPFNSSNNRRGFGTRANIRVSADGNVLSTWASDVSPSGLQTYVRVGDSWSGHYEHDSAGYLVPSPDGKRIYTVKGIYTNQLRRLGGKNSGYSIPALHGPYYLTVSGNDMLDKSPEKVSLKMEGDERPLAEIPHLDDVFHEDDRWSRQRLTLDKRLFLIPHADLIIQLASSNDKFTAVHFDIEEAMQESDVDFLFVSSQPPLALNAGDELQYQIEVKSKAGGVRYSLDAGPEEMQLSPTGLLTWATTEKSPAKSNVIITVDDQSGQQVFHTFALAVKGGDAETSAVAAPRPVTDGAPETIATTPTDAKEESKEVKLPGTVSDVVVGGNGRLLFFHLRDLKKIAILDVSKAKITGYLAASDDDTRVVAGATRAVVFSMTQGVVTRYRLDTFERELSVTTPFPDPVQYVGMGAGSEGPILLRTSMGTGALDRCTFHFMDIHTMKPMEVDWPHDRQPHSVYRDRNFIQASTNGDAFVVQGIGVLRRKGTTVEILGDHSSHGILPAADGKHFFANGRLLNANLQPMGDESTTFGIAVPSVTGRYFLSFNNTRSHPGEAVSEQQNAKLYAFGDNRPLVTIQDLAVPSRADNANIRGFEKRVFFVPDAQVIATVPSSDDRVVLRRFSVDQALEASGVDYLVVDSHAPAHAEIGKRYAYVMNVKSKRGGVKYSLDAAPTDMKVSADGELTWDVPKDLENGEHSVIVTIRDDSGQSVFHTFSIEIPEIKQRVAAAQKRFQVEVSDPMIAPQLPTIDARHDAPRQEIESQQAAPQERLAGQRRKESTEQSIADSTFRPSMRTWTDSSGKHVVVASFVALIEKKTVVLQLENGENRKVALSQLSNDDIYEAVKSALLQQGMKMDRPPESPFNEP